MYKMISLGLLMVAAAVSAVHVKHFHQLRAAKDSKHITIGDLHVPAGKTLKLDDLEPGTVVEFAGTVTFGHANWEGPLILIKGENITVEGKPGHLIDCEGERWWDGKGGNDGVQKPRFFVAILTDSSINGLKVKNIPVHGFGIVSSKNLQMTNIHLDVADGRTKGGHNTDGFDVANSQNITIADSYVENQDDCLAINSGTDITFERNVCVGGHGISIGSVGGRDNNVVRKVKVLHCKVHNSYNGLRIKTIKGATGVVKDVLFDDVELKNIDRYGIIIQGNYLNSGPKGDPTPGVPITDLTVNNVRGNVLKEGTNVYVWVAGASNWKWTDVNIDGGKNDVDQKGVPPGVKW